MFTLKGKKAYLLDVEKFKAKYGLEEKLSHLEWVEGACNYIGFLETLSDPGMAPLTVGRTILVSLSLALTPLKFSR